jgi:hypothetical protein
MDAADWQPFAIYRDLSGSIAVKRIPIDGVSDGKLRLPLE